MTHSLALQKYTILAQVLLIHNTFNPLFTPSNPSSFASILFEVFKMSQLNDKSRDQEKPTWTTEIFYREKNGRYHQSQRTRCTNHEAMRVLLDRYPLPSPEDLLLKDCQTRRDKVPPVNKTDTPAPPPAVGKKQQGRNRTGKPPRFPVHQLPSSLTSLPVRSRPLPASDRECDKCHGTGRVTKNEKRASPPSEFTNRNETRSASKSSNGQRDAGSYRKNKYKKNRPAQPKSLQEHALANKEEFVVVDPSERGDEGEDGWEMDFSIGE